MRTFEATASGLVPLADGLSPRDASAGLPSGAYTTLRTHHGSRVLRLSDHVGRLTESAGLKEQPGDLSLERGRGAGGACPRLGWLRRLAPRAALGPAAPVRLDRAVHAARGGPLPQRRLVRD